MRFIRKEKLIFGDKFAKIRRILSRMPQSLRDGNNAHKKTDNFENLNKKLELALNR